MFNNIWKNHLSPISHCLHRDEDKGNTKTHQQQRQLSCRSFCIEILVCYVPLSGYIYCTKYSGCTDISFWIQDLYVILKKWEISWWNISPVGFAFLNHLDIRKSTFTPFFKANLNGLDGNVLLLGEVNYRNFHFHLFCCCCFLILDYYLFETRLIICTKYNGEPNLDCAALGDHFLARLWRQKA